MKEYNRLTSSGEKPSLAAECAISRVFCAGRFYERFKRYYGDEK